MALSTQLDPAIVSLLACPACHSELRFDEAHLLCAGCRRAYPVIDGIPVLIVERAELLADGDEQKDSASGNL